MSPPGRLVSKAASTEGRGKARRARRRASVGGRHAELHVTQFHRGGRPKRESAPQRIARRVIQSAAGRGQGGFTLIELLIAGVILGIAASIAVPNYTHFVARSRILDGVAKLADHRARMEQLFLDRRAYVDEAGRCGIAPPAVSAADAFELSCVGSGSSYVYTATGIAGKGMGGFVFAIDETGSRTTVSVPRGWARTPECWTIRKDGSCV